jgi:cytochrome c551/c552
VDYRYDEGAIDVQSVKVHNGVVGVWTTIAMPPAATIKDDELKLILALILPH